MGYLRPKIEELETNSKIQKIKDMYKCNMELKKGTRLDVIE